MADPVVCTVACVASAIVGYILGLHAWKPKPKYLGEFDSLGKAIDALRVAAEMWKKEAEERSGDENICPACGTRRIAFGLGLCTVCFEEECEAKRSKSSGKSK